MSPALNGSSAIRRFEGSNAIKICNGMTFNFYTGLAHILNFAMQVGNLQNSYNAVQKSLEVFPGHMDSKELMKQLEQHFAAL